MSQASIRDIALNVVLGLCAAVALSAPVLADPPDWAPAHGERDKHQEGDDRGDRGDEDRDEHHGDRRDGEDSHHDRHQRHDDRGRNGGHRVYRGYGGRDWPDDYGISGGRCDRGAVGAVLGGVIGGAVGSQVSQAKDRTVAVIIGAAVGALIGHQIGRDMDVGDRGCMGHSLELARDGRPVGWVNSQSGRSYVVTPVGPWAQGGTSCRQFKLRTAAQGRVSNETGRACRSGDGVWQFR